MGKPNAGNAALLRSEFIGFESDTRGSETSQYPEEEKTNSDSVSSGERKRNSPNHPACGMGLRDLDVALLKDSGTVWKVRPQRVIVPYAKSGDSLEVSQVERDT